MKNHIIGKTSFYTCFPEPVLWGAAVPESFGVLHKDVSLLDAGSSILRWTVSVKRQNELHIAPFSPDYNESHGCRSE